MSSRRALLESLLLSRLPSAYQEVEYIESTGTQYIDSGFVPSQNTEVKVNFYQVSAINSWNFIFGARVGAGYSEFSLVYQSSSNMGWRDDYGENNRLYFNNTNIVGKFECYKNKNITTLNNVSVSHTAYNFQTVYPLVIFGINSGGTVNTEECSQIKLYSCQIYNNSVLVRNFVPCYRKADNVAGLYDLVNGVFYTNAGSGTFIVGGNV